MNASRNRLLVPAAACGLLLVPIVAGAENVPREALSGELPACPRHLDQAEIEAGRLSLREILEHGELLFTAVFNTLDGEGRPASTGTGAPRVPDQPAFIRTSAPDANSCAGCHNQPRVGGAGDFVANVFVLAQARDPVTFSVGPESGNERNTLGMWGSGAIELLAREMSADLIAIREDARAVASATGIAVTRPLLTKGLSFGKITVFPDGRVDPTEIEGIDWDLIVKPFHQKGAVVSLREFSNNAMNHHHGIQTVERFGSGADPDADGVRDEMTVGDVTAITIWQALLPVPGRRLPPDASRRVTTQRGESVFSQVGCAGCHKPALVLNDTVFTEPNPFNPSGNLRLEDVGTPFRFDLTTQGARPRLERSPQGGAVVRAFTDLKRHDLTDADLTFFANEQIAQGTLAGFADPSSFSVAPVPRPTSQFLTRKLWDAGSSAPYGHRGDLTTLSEAIYFHGGEARASRDAFLQLDDADKSAVVDFLKSLQVLPPGSAEALPGHGSPR